MSAALIEYLSVTTNIIKGFSIGLAGICCIALCLSMVEENLRLSYGKRKALVIVIAVALLIIIFLPTGDFWKLL